MPSLTPPDTGNWVYFLAKIARPGKRAYVRIPSRYIEAKLVDPTGFYRIFFRPVITGTTVTTDERTWREFTKKLARVEAGGTAVGFFIPAAEMQAEAINFDKIHEFFLKVLPRRPAANESNTQ